MILCIHEEAVDNKTNDYRKVVLQADTTAEAAALPTTGEGITDLADAVTLYPSSVCKCVADGSVYVLGGDNTWYKQP